MLLLTLLQVSSTPPVQTLFENGGAAGWTGVGLLGVVLGWLFGWHLPAKDKQISEIYTGHTEHVEKLNAMHAAIVEKMTEKFSKEMSDMRADYKASLKEVVDHCEREIGRIVDRGLK